MTGAPPPILERRLDLATLVAYSAATWDWYPTHYDREVTSAAGLAGPLVDGQMFGGLLAEQALDWAPAGTRVVAMGFRFRSMVFAGETVRCEATIESRSHNRVRLAQRVVVGDRVAVEPAWTVVELPA